MLKPAAEEYHLMLEDFRVHNDEKAADEKNPLSHDQCQNQWTKGVLGNALFPNTQCPSLYWVVG